MITKGVTYMSNIKEVKRVIVNELNSEETNIEFVNEEMNALSITDATRVLRDINNYREDISRKLCDCLNEKLMDNIKNRLIDELNPDETTEIVIPGEIMEKLIHIRNSIPGELIPDYEKMANELNNAGVKGKEQLLLLQERSESLVESLKPFLSEDMLSIIS